MYVQIPGSDCARALETKTLVKCGNVEVRSVLPLTPKLRSVAVQLAVQRAARLAAAPRVSGHGSLNRSTGQIRDAHAAPSCCCYYYCCLLFVVCCCMQFNLIQFMVPMSCAFLDRES